MSVLERIQRLCKENSINPTKLETELDFGKGTLYKWDKSAPSSDRLEKVATRLNVTTDYLLGRTTRSVIDDRLAAKYITLEAVSKKTNVPLYWLKNLDSFVPRGWGNDYEIGYEWIARIEKELDFPEGELKTLLARQEIPTYDGPSISPEEAFKTPFIKEDETAYNLDIPLSTEEKLLVKAFLETIRKAKQDKKE